MTRIALLSDTHGFFDQRFKKHLLGVDEIWHAGDIGNLSVTDNLRDFASLRVVYGNIDDHKARREFSENLVFNCEKLKVWMTHIGGNPNCYRKGIREKLIEISPDIFICGHSHILRVAYDKKYKCWHLNPGAAGKHGFHKKQTMLKFEINEGNIQNMNLVELDRK